MMILTTNFSYHDLFATFIEHLAQNVLHLSNKFVMYQLKHKRTMLRNQVG